MQRLTTDGTALEIWYEAGPTGYVIQRQLTAMDLVCRVAAPTLIPSRSGDRIKTDRRDALRLAELARGGLLTSIRVPDAADEALRDLVRLRGQVRDATTRQKHQLRAFLRTHGVRADVRGKPWSQAWRRWLEPLCLADPTQQLVLDELRTGLSELEGRLGRIEAGLATAAVTSQLADLIAAYQTLRGVDLLTAVTLAAELGDLSRFDTAGEAMSYVGLIPSEHSSGGRRRQGGITKTGNRRARHVLVEAAWHYRWQPRLSLALKRRQAGQSATLCHLSWQAQQRLCPRFRRLEARGKPRPVVVTAVARELVGFLWAMSRQVRLEQQSGTQLALPTAA
jgi:transposase